MRLTAEEKEICKKYSARDDTGLVHCWECPLRANDRDCVCKRDATAEEYKEFKDYK